MFITATQRYTEAAMPVTVIFKPPVTVLGVTETVRPLGFLPITVVEVAPISAADAAVASLCATPSTLNPPPKPVAAGIVVAAADRGAVPRASQ